MALTSNFPFATKTLFGVIKVHYSYPHHIFLFSLPTSCPEHHKVLIADKNVKFNSVLTNISHLSQSIMSSKTEGDSRIQELKSRVQSLCSRDLEEDEKRAVQQKARAAEEAWNKFLQNLRETVSEAERGSALHAQLRSFETLRGTTSSWLQEKQLLLVSPDRRTDPQQAIKSAQVSLNQNLTCASKIRT